MFNYKELFANFLLGKMDPRSLVYNIPDDIIHLIKEHYIDMWTPKVERQEYIKIDPPVRGYPHNPNLAEKYYQEVWTIVYNGAVIRYRGDGLPSTVDYNSENKVVRMEWSIYDRPGSEKYQTIYDPDTGLEIYSQDIYM